MKYDASVIGLGLERLETALGQALRSEQLAQSTNLLLRHSDKRALIEAKEFEIRDAISESCREWIQTNELPSFCDLEAFYLLFVRLDCASKIAHWLRAGGLDYSQSDVNLFLEFLTIDSWDDFGLSLWKNSIGTRS